MKSPAEIRADVDKILDIDNLWADHRKNLPGLCNEMVKAAQEITDYICALVPEEQPKTDLISLPQEARPCLHHGEFTTCVMGFNRTCGVCPCILTFTSPTKWEIKPD